MKSKLTVVILFIILCLLFSACVIDNHEINEEAFFGEWIITKNIASNKVSAYSPEDIEKMIGKSILYTKSLASFDGEDLKDPYYKIEIYTKKENDDDCYVKFEDIGIESDAVESVEVYPNKDSISAWLMPASLFLVKDNNTLILINDGEFFELVRKK